MRVLVLLSLVACAACTDVSLRSIPAPPPKPIDNRFELRGRFCTLDPTAVEFPAKILFVVDTSDSMSQTDPPNPLDGNFTGRGRAVIEVINALAGTPGVEIGIITFHSSANDLTGGFKPDLTATDVAALTMAAANLASEDGQTNYEGAIDLAFQVLLDDIAQADELSRTRSKYTVIFLSDGLPNPIDPPDNTTESIVRGVSGIQRLERERRLVELKLHTVYLSGRTPPQFQLGPIGLLRNMAEAGKGTFRNIGNGESINFLDIGFTAFRRTFALKSFTVVDRNARPGSDLRTAVDSDGDGITDGAEDLIGTDPTRADTDGDGFGDLLEDRLRNAGFDPLDPNDADCKVTPEDDYNRRDDDGDGLRNCEERFLGSNPRIFDTDADGYADPIEIAAGLSPTEDETVQDLDRDGVKNSAELVLHTDPLLDDQKSAPSFRYFYDLREEGIVNSRVCYSFTVDGIKMTSPIGGGVNDIYVYAGEAPSDLPSDFGDFRIACVRPAYDLATDTKYPANGRLELTDEDFHPPVRTSSAAAFDPEVHCKRP